MEVATSYVALGIVTSFIFFLKFHFIATLLSSCIILYQIMCCVGSVVDVGRAVRDNIKEIITIIFTIN